MGDPVFAAAQTLLRTVWEAFTDECSGIEDAELHTLLLAAGVVEEVVYDPEVHGVGDAEAGDPWYVLNDLGKALLGKGETASGESSAELASLASYALMDNDASAREKRLAASVLSQAPNRSSRG